MTTQSVDPPFPIFTNKAGGPLENGYIWIGQANMDPQANPISVYWDAALTQPSGQPIRTLAGYPSNNGTPARLYVNSDFSIRVQDKNGITVYSATTINQVYSSDLFTFIQSGAGAVVRTAQDKMRETFSVKDFGAKGDGVNDDTYAIQTAFLALPNNATMVFPRGEYIVSDSISISASGISVVGENSTIRQTAQFKKTLNFINPTKITVSNLKIVGVGTEFIGGNPATTSYNGVAGIFFAGAVDCKVYDCFVTNHAGGGIRFTDADNLSILNTTIIGVGVAGGIPAGVLANFGDAAIGVANAPTGDKDVVISGCFIRDHCFGVLSSRRSGLTVIGSVIGPIPGQHGVYAAAKSELVVSGCTFKDIAGEAIKNQIAASTDINTNNCVVSGNAFLNVGQSCVAMAPASGSTVGRYNNITISGNSAYNTGNYFATIRRCDGALIAANSIYLCGAHPIELENFNGKISDNKIKNASWSAVYLQANGPCEISENLIEDVCLNTEGSVTPSIRYQVMIYVTAEAGTGTGHNIVTRNNTYRMNSSPAQLVRCFRSSSTVDIFLNRMHNETGLPMQIDSLYAQDIGYSPNADQVVSASLDPTTPRYGRGRRELFGTQNPASAAMTDTFRRGDVCWNATPSAGGTPGWVCVTDGAPGTWKAMANVAV